MKALVNITDLSKVTGIPVRTLRTLQHSGQIPCVKLGYRTIFYDLDKVFSAIEQISKKQQTKT